MSPQAVLRLARAPVDDGGRPGKLSLRMTTTTAGKSGDLGPLLSPLLGHCFCDAGIKARSLFPALRSGRHPEDALVAAGNNIGRLQRGQVLQPEACSLGLAMAELPGLNALRKFPVVYDEASALARTDPPVLSKNDPALATRPIFPLTLFL